MEELLDKIESADDIDRDIAWSILKRKDPKFGIMRKLKCFARVFGVNEDSVLEEAEQNEDGWIIDYDNRMVLHDALVKGKVPE